MNRYTEFLNLGKITSKPLKLYHSSPSNILKTNSPLVISYLIYKFLNTEEIPYIGSFVHKPHEVLERDDPEFDIGIFKCRLYDTGSEIYPVLYSSKSVTPSVFTNTIVHGYNIFSEIFVRCKIRFISRNPVYIAYEASHGPEIVVALRDLINRYGITNDSLFQRRCKKIFEYDSDVKSEDQPDQEVSIDTYVLDEDVTQLQKFRKFDMEKKLEVVIKHESE